MAASPEPLTAQQQAELDNLCEALSQMSDFDLSDVATLQAQASKVPRDRVLDELLVIYWRRVGINEPIDEIDAAQKLGCNIGVLRKAKRIVAKEQEAPAVDISRWLGRYVFSEGIGRGGFGRVGRYHDTYLNQEVAIKLPRSPSTTTLDDALRESRKAVQVKSNRVVRVIDVGYLWDEWDDPIFLSQDSSFFSAFRPAIVMEYAERGSLQDRIGSGPWQLANVIGQFPKIASGVDDIHSAGLVHRDLKPQNILYGADGLPRVADFGLAEAWLNGGPQPPAGTLLWMAPEVLDSLDRRITVTPSRSQDIWSLGLILYQLLTGKHPFATSDWRQSIRTGQFEPVNQAAPQLSSRWQDVVSTCLHTDPDRRFFHVKDLLAAFESSIDSHVQIGPRIIQPPEPHKTLGKDSIALARRDAIEFNELYHFCLPLHCASTLDDSRQSASSNDQLVGEQLISEIRRGTKLMFLLGEVGAGKTWALKRLFVDLMTERAADKTKKIPCIVSLSEKLEPEDGKTWPWSRNTLTDGLTSDEAVLLLDAYDEAVAKCPPGSRRKLLDAVLELTARGFQVVLASRSHLFGGNKQLARIVKAATYGLPGTKRSPPSYCAIYVKPLTDNSIRKFLVEEYGDASGKLWSRMAAVVDLADLASRPVMLPMVCDSLSEIENSQRDDGQPITAGHLYRIYTERWLSRESGRLGLGGSDARILFENLALLFLNSSTESVKFSELPAIFPDFFPPSYLSHQREELTFHLGSSSFLTVSSLGQCRFNHRSFFEYFLAERIISAITNGEIDLELRRFPSKVTNAFTVDLLLDNTGWEESILQTFSLYTSPIMRYLCVYLITRAAQKGRTFSLTELKAVFEAQIAVERKAFVIRELLVAMVSLEIEVDERAIELHLQNPIPSDEIEMELRDYYGSVEEAREYLRNRLATATAAYSGDVTPNRLMPGNLQLFYLISLAAICTDKDSAILCHFAKHGTRLERQVADAGLHSNDES